MIPFSSIYNNSELFELVQLAVTNTNRNNTIMSTT